MTNNFFFLNFMMVLCFPKNFGGAYSCRLVLPSKKKFPDDKFCSVSRNLFIFADIVVYYKIQVKFNIQVWGFYHPGVMPLESLKNCPIYGFQMITFVHFVGTVSYLQTLLLITKYRSGSIFRFESFTIVELCPNEDWKFSNLCFQDDNLFLL